MEAQITLKIHALNSMDTQIGGRNFKDEKKNRVRSFKANSNMGPKQINTSFGKVVVAAMEPIFSMARQQPLGLKNGTQEKENNR